MGGDGVRTVLLVEGESDRNAVETLARRRGQDLVAAGVRVDVLHGVTNIGHALPGVVAAGLRAGGLYDAGEQHFVRRALERTGLRAEGSAAPLSDQGFFVCVLDLEDELIRAIGVDGVLAVVKREGELDGFHILQRQPAHRDRPAEEQVRRFLGTRAGRKARYGHLLAAAVPLDRVPPPLAGVIGWALRGQQPEHGRLRNV